MIRKAGPRITGHRAEFQRKYFDNDVILDVFAVTWVWKAGGKSWF
jgi:hypothetical protein